MLESRIWGHLGSWHQTLTGICNQCGFGIIANPHFVPQSTPLESVEKGMGEVRELERVQNMRMNGTWSPDLRDMLQLT